MISIFPSVKAQATKLLKTISVLNLGLTPKTVEGLKIVTQKSLLFSFNKSHSAFHLEDAYSVIGFLIDLSSSSSLLVLDIP